MVAFVVCEGVQPSSVQKGQTTSYVLRFALNTLSYLFETDSELLLATICFDFSEKAPPSLASILQRNQTHTMRFTSAILMASSVCRSNAFSLQPLKLPVISNQLAANRYKTSRFVLAEDAAETTTGKVPLGIPGTAKMDTPWEELGFEFRPTKSNLRITYTDGEWGEMELCEVSP